MTLNPFTIIGGLAGDIVEVCKSTGNALADAPGQVADGYKAGLIITPDNGQQPTSPVIEAAGTATADTETPKKSDDI